MKLYHRDKAKAYRRLMLDMLEVCPRRFRDDFLLIMALVKGDGDLASYSCGMHEFQLQFFYRLKASRVFRNASAHQHTVLQSIISRLEEAHMYDTGRPFKFESAEERQASRKAGMESIRRQIAWSERHPFLACLLMSRLNIAVILMMIIMPVVAGFMAFVFDWHYTALSF
ncbi:hypothetical protein [Pantoea agglomerans]|uniref:hypothetical protein n=1 Tax=Enterobacter agglomerans TaxID=549 RepID=UPI00320B810C